MTSLTDVYEGGVGSVTTPRRLSIGTGLFGLGVVAVAVAIALATTGLGSELGVYETRELAGVLAGLGLPAIFLGVFVVFPASRRTRAAAVIGAGLAALGVALFRTVYPTRWVGAPEADPALTLLATVTYAFGALAAFGCMFVAAVRFKTRNDPGGAARMIVTEEGEIRFVEPDDAGRSGKGGVGLVGSDVADVGSTPGSGGASGGRTGAAPASDGGAAATDAGPAESPDATPDTGDGPATVRSRRAAPDPYCGNCDQFTYVRANGELTPYCALDDRLMEDMDACEDWTPNS